MFLLVFNQIASVESPAMPSRSSYLGIFFLSTAIIIFELTITRLLSVTLYYHLAFLVISIVMLGISLGAMLVFCYQDRFPQSQISELLNKYCLGFAILSPLATVVHVLMPLELSAKLQYAVCIVVTSLLFCASFICAGICTCLILTRFGEKTSKLYAADLIGAAFGCYVFVLTLGPLDGVSETFLVGAIACLAAWFFARPGGSPAKCGAAGVALFLTASILNSYCVNVAHSGLRISWMHGSFVAVPLLERWSPIGRVTVSGNPEELKAYRTLGYSNLGPMALVRGLDIDIDGSARTSILGYNDNAKEAEFLKYDVVYLAHHLRPNSDVLIIGSGGGKDVVAALAFGQARVTGVELNSYILEILTHNFDGFAGHLSQLKNVSFANDEARHYISNSKEKFDIIQMSLIDTWAATSSGAYILSENCLYTVEAWTDFLKHLKPGGVYTVSRWFRGDPPAEMLRTVSLASAALKGIGIDNAQKHIILVKNGSGPVATGTLLVSPDEFTEADVKHVLALCQRMHFDCILAPGQPHSQLFSDVLAQKNGSEDSPFNFTAPTDDSPFFFNMIKLNKVFSKLNTSDIDANWQAITILVGAVFLAVYGSLLLTILPLRIAKEKLDLEATQLGTYFFSIGLGFMFVEISQIQRLIVVLGHPTYGLTCVLFTLLLSGGVGSLCSGYLGRSASGDRNLLFALLTSLIVFGLLSERIFPGLHHLDELARIVCSSLALSIPGFCMGFAFPGGMRKLTASKQKLAPWFWGLNGAGSVCGSVVALFISIGFGITCLFWTGVFCYVVALFAFIVLSPKAGDSGKLEFGSQT